MSEQFDAYERGRASAEDYMADDHTETVSEVRDILDEFAEMAEKLGRKLLKLKAVEQFIPPTNDERFGYLPGKHVTDENVIDQMRSDARAALSAWLKDEIAKHAE